MEHAAELGIRKSGQTATSTVTVSLDSKQENHFPPALLAAAFENSPLLILNWGY
jgi:hypothetical protein